MLKSKAYLHVGLFVCALAVCSSSAHAQTALISNERSAANGPVCPGEGGDCCDPDGNGTTGCDDIACCETVCAVDPFCCSVTWDSVCAQEAAENPGLCTALCTGCGDGICDPAENCESCPTDCPCPEGASCVAGECVVCGDDICSPSENCTTCLTDCPCPDGLVCDGGECFECVSDADCIPADPCSPASECIDQRCVGIGEVLSHQKISDTEGGFTGILDDADAFGRSVAFIGDLDRDGVDDLSVSAFGDDDGGTNRGAVWLLFLYGDGTVKSHQKISDTEGGFTGILDDNDRFGSSVASIGDLDGDGVADLAVGAYGDNDGGPNRGAVWVLFLNDDGTVKSHQKISDTEGGFTGILDDSDRFGSSVASLGDLDGDGVVDLAVGAPFDEDGGNARGAVWVLFLNDDGTVKSHQKISQTEGGFTGMLDDGDRFGRSVASICDLDGNGVSELAVGANEDDDGGLNRGAVWILFLNNDGTVKSHQKISATEGGFTGMLSNSDRFGVSVAAVSDLDADGVAEVAVGAYRDNDGGGLRGAVWILFLNNDGTVKSHQKISDTEGGFTGMLATHDHFGISVASIGDLNGDGVAAVAAGADGDNDGGGGGSDRGAVWVLFPAGGQAPYCDDGDPCSIDECVDGECQYTPVDCSVFDDQCNTASCDPDGEKTNCNILCDILTPVANGTNCDDGNPCTSFDAAEGGADACDGDGTCQGIQVDCSRLSDQCNVGVCNPNSGECQADPLSTTAAGEVLSHQKISDTEGGFTGILDDNNFFGTSVASLGDLDGDGVADLAVGAALDNDGGFAHGAVWLLFLNADGTVKSHQKISALHGGFTGILDGQDLFGSSVASIGDLDGDGVTDLAVGAMWDGDGGNARGAVWVLFLNTDGTVKSHQKISSTQGTFQGPLNDDDRFGSSVASLGDLDGDGVTDLAVGAVWDSDGGDARGAVWVLFLNDDGTVKSHQKISDTQGGFTGILDDGDFFGASVAALGDLDGDSVGDLAVGEHQDDDAGAGRGAVWILFLNSDGTVKSHQKINDARGGFTGGLDDGDAFGRSVAGLGDLDGDGMPDLAVGAIFDDDGGPSRGATWLLFLNSDGTVKSHKKISDTQGGFDGALDDGDAFGIAIAVLGDLDGDGPIDLAVGAVGDDDGGVLHGAVWVLFLDDGIDPPDCDDGLFCNGEESCEEGECFSTGDPCPLDSICDEDQDVCINTGACCGCDCAGLMCSETTEVDCAGEFAGLGTTCVGGCDDVVTCTPEGACCFCNASNEPECVVTTEEGCASAKGGYLGDCSTCEGVACELFEPCEPVGCCVCIGNRCDDTQSPWNLELEGSDNCAELGGTIGSCVEHSCPECVDNSDCPFGPCIGGACTGEEPCGCCAGKVTDLCLVNGGATGVITVKAKGGIVFEGEVASGATFCFGPHEGQSTLGKKIDVCQSDGCSGSGSGSGSGFCAGGCKTKIKTDCKKHIGPGDVFGDFTVESGSSLIGGPLCDADDPACASGSGSGSNASDD